MKKFIVIVSTFIYVNTWAQRTNIDETPYKWSGDGKGNGTQTIFGLFGGVSISNLEGFGTLTAPAFSAFFAIPVSKYFRVRPECGYMRFGSQNEVSSQHYNYLIIPVLVSFEFSKKCYALAGPQMGLALNSALTTGNNDALHQQDFSIVSGLEYMPGWFGLAMRYQYGLNNNGFGNYNRGLRAGININL